MYSDYPLDDILDFLMKMFLKSFRFEYKFVIDIMREEHIVSIVEEQTIKESIEEDAAINIVFTLLKSLLIPLGSKNLITNRSLRKTYDVPIEPVINELKQKELEGCQAADERTQKER
jgi:hypothetical protein